ncbi:interferon gamma receptor 1-like [Syngnathus acus]|uniref:interferon gamma receptor 1-like n=1 Tax=Syngnathus acus TaxID=161584 RepID=UPI0018864321|nr:interferon gamma receptor 1-like [Syngnathus acus]
MPAIVAFTTALLMLLECALVQQLADVPLAPPTNVTVNCTDTQGTVHWQYGEEAHVRFLVDVGNSKSKPERNAVQEHFYNCITARVWESLESAMDVHYVGVAAVVPDGRSSPQISTTFTYNSVKLAEVKCKLAFPDVDVKADDGSVIVSFRNPLHQNPQLRLATRGAATFRFNATYDSRAVENSCHPHQNVCRANVTFPPGSAECVTLTGWVSDSGGGRLEFGPSGRACVKRSSGRVPLLVVLTRVLVVAGLLICAVVLVWRRLAKAPKEPLFPQVSACCQNWINWIQSCFACSSGLLQGQRWHRPPQFEGPAHLSGGVQFLDSPLPQEDEVQEVEQEELKVEEDEEGKGCWG